MDTYIVALDVFLKSFHQYFIYYFNSYTHIDFSIAPLLVQVQNIHDLLYDQKRLYMEVF
jgi:hypothetical protein